MVDLIVGMMLPSVSTCLLLGAIGCAEVCAIEVNRRSKRARKETARPHAHRPHAWRTAASVRCAQTLPSERLSTGPSPVCAST